MRQEGTGAWQWAGFALLIVGVCALFAGTFALVAVLLFQSCRYAC